MKYILVKNGEEIQVFKNKLDLYEHWEVLRNDLMKSGNFDCSVGFWMMDRERNIYEVNHPKDSITVSYDRNHFEGLMRKKKGEK